MIRKNTTQCPSFVRAGTAYPLRFNRTIVRDRPISLDLIIPVYNEQSVLPHLFDTLSSVFDDDTLALHRVQKVRWLFIDDGSSDRTAELIISRINQGLPASLYRFSRNFGHQAAITAGLDLADADVVAIIDADLQDPPELIFKMIQEWRQGFDIIYGIRRKRKENFLKVASYWIFYRLLALLSDIKIPKDAGDFSLMDRIVVQVIRTIPDHLRFNRGIRAWVGFKQKGLEYERMARGAGETKYSFRSLYALATDGLAWSSTKPLRIAQFSSFAFALLAFVMAIFTLATSLGERPMDSTTLWLMMTNFIMLFGFAVTSLCLYTISAYIGRTYLEAKSRPNYIIMEQVGGTSSADDGMQPSQSCGQEDDL